MILRAMLYSLLEGLEVKNPPDWLSFMVLLWRRDLLVRSKRWEAKERSRLVIDRLRLVSSMWRSKLVWRNLLALSSI